MRTVYVFVAAIVVSSSVLAPLAACSGSGSGLFALDAGADAAGGSGGRSNLTMVGELCNAGEGLGRWDKGGGCCTECLDTSGACRVCVEPSEAGIGGGGTGGSGVDGGTGDAGSYDGSCAHDPCLLGPALDPHCDPCVLAVCDLVTSCCSTAWDFGCLLEAASGSVVGCPQGEKSACTTSNDCAHSPCVVGSSLDGDPALACSWMVYKVCNSTPDPGPDAGPGPLPDCCTKMWGQDCVDSAKMWGQVCP